jgi:hypothetical protein
MPRARFLITIGAAGLLATYAGETLRRVVGSILDEQAAEARLDVIATNTAERAAMDRDVTDFWESVRRARRMSRVDVIEFVQARAAAGDYFTPRYDIETDSVPPPPDPMEGPCDTTTRPSPPDTAPPTTTP